MEKILSKEDLISYETKHYLITKEIAYKAYNTKNMQEALTIMEDFKLDNLTEKNITNKINQYNNEKENNFFNRLKEKDFILATALIKKIGKYKFGKIEFMDNMQ